MFVSGLIRTISFLGIFGAIAAMIMVSDKRFEHKWRKTLAMVGFVVIAALSSFAAANATGVPPVQSPVRDIEQVQGGSMDAVYMLQGQPQRTLQGSALTVQ